MHHKILVVDDDQELCELIQTYLEQESFEVTTVHDGSEAVTLIKKSNYDLIVLDVMLPSLSGFEVLQTLRKNNNIPVLMLTAKGDEIDRIVGLEIGADDYLTKPCNSRELVARIRSIIRRYESLPKHLNHNALEIILDDLILDTQRREVKVSEEVMDLTATEYDILLLLVNNHGQLISRETISEQCLGRKLSQYDRSIDMHISHIRKKLGVTKNNEERIKTVRGTGYQYVAI